MATKLTNGNGNGSRNQATLDLASNRPNGIKLAPFHEVFASNYGLYGLHTVQERALPDARDGLKPIHRRILYTLYEGNYRSNGPHRKSAEIVGKVMGDRHPHGDASIYDAMVRMAQPFSMRYTFVNGQGNWGASDGSPAAAYRYTEAKLTPLAEALLSDDLAKQTVPLQLTYKEDPKVLEPLYLPGHIPPVINSIDGIAVGISTSVPSHNLSEALRACSAMLDAGVLDNNKGPEQANNSDSGNWISLASKATKKFPIEKLMQYMPGPDYPEGGKILAGRGGVREYLETGRGRFIIRATIVLEQLSPTKKALVITALPPIGRDQVINSIIDAINDRKLDGLVAEPPLDETNEERTRIVLELKRDAKPDQLIEVLYKHTKLEIAVSVQLYFLFANHAGGEATIPKQTGMVEILAYWLHHQLDVLERRLRFELAGFQRRLSTVEALIIGATNAQQLVKIFQESDGKAAAKEAIKVRYKLTDEQAEVIANMSLSQVTRPDSGKYKAEKEELLGKISRHEELLASRPKRIALLKKELADTEKKFGDARRTEIDRTTAEAAANASAGKISENSEVQPLHDPMALAIYTDNTIKATPLDAFGPKSRSVKADENLVKLVGVAADEFVLAASSAGKIYGIPLSQLDVSTRAGKGDLLKRHLKLTNDERIVDLLPVPNKAFNNVDSDSDTLYLVEFSALGKVKKSAINEYRTASASGIGSLKLAEGDEVIASVLSNGQGEYFVTTDSGQTLRFSDEKLSAQGRIGQGQAAIALDKTARVVSAEFFSSRKNNAATKNEAQATMSDLFALQEQHAKSEKKAANNQPNNTTSVQFSLFGGDGSTSDNKEANQNSQPITENIDTVARYLLVLTQQGLIKKTPLEEYPQKGRATVGVATLMFSSEDDKVAATKIVSEADETVLISNNNSNPAIIVELASLPELARAKKAMPYTGLSGNGNGSARIVSTVAE